MAALAVTPIISQADGNKGSNNEGDKGQRGQCQDLPSQAQLLAALKSVVTVGQTNNSGFGLNMWVTTVNRDGQVCAGAGNAVAGNVIDAVAAMAM